MYKEVPPDCVSTEQLVFKLRWSHAGMQRQSEVKFSSLQSDDMHLDLGLKIAVSSMSSLKSFSRCRPYLLEDLCCILEELWRLMSRKLRIAA